MLTTRNVKVQEILRRSRKPVRELPRTVTTRDRNVREILNKQGLQGFFDKQWQAGPLGVKRPLAEVLPENSWLGHRCFIFAGGPSLDGMDYKQFENELTIGINWSTIRTDEEKMLEPTIMISMDGRVYEWIRDGVYDKRDGLPIKKRYDEYQGLKVWADLSNKVRWPCFFVRAIAGNRLTNTMAEGVGCGNNAGFAAFNLAVLLGANPIYLLGYDMKFEKGKSHCHSGHPTPFNENMMKSFMKPFYESARAIKGRKIQVYNCNKRSALNAFPFSDIPKDLKKDNVIIVSYYTKGSLYENEAKRLKDSLWRFSLKHDVRGIDDRGNWNLNCHFKPEYILMMLDKYKPYPVVWVDCDAVIKSYPDLFWRIQSDFGVYHKPRFRRKEHTHLKETLSGTLYFANNEKARGLLKSWVELNKKNPHKWDQWNLAEALRTWNGTVKELPASYCKIFDSNEDEQKAVENPVIEHYQASRKVRSKR